MKTLNQYINESKIDNAINESYRFSDYILYGNIKKELSDLYDFEDNEAKEKVDEIVKCINANTDNFVKNVGKENIKYVKYNTLFHCPDFAKSLSNTDIPIIKSKFIENNYNYYCNFPMQYAFSVLGPWQSDRCELFSCKFNNFTNVLKRFSKYNKNLWYIEMFFDIDEYNFPQSENEFKELYKDITGSSRFPSQMNVDFDKADWEKYDVFVGLKSKAKIQPIVFRKPAGTFIQKFLIPFMEKYTINFIYLYIESYAEKINFMYDKSNDTVYYTW